MRSKRTLFRVLALAVIGAVGIVVGLHAEVAAPSTEAPIPSGHQVQSFELPT